MSAVSPSFPPHEAVHVLSDPESGLRGFIAIHSTALGPAAGGCRIWRYRSDREMLDDALRLSAGMSFKNALAGLPFGGGKAVLALPEGEDWDRERLFKAFGRAVERLDGAYVTAEDVGSSIADMKVVSGKTQYVAGLPSKGGATGGDPSPWTAAGVFMAMQAAWSHATGKSLAGVVVGVQGLGHVGADLAERLHLAGARLVVSDVDPDRLSDAVDRFGAKVVEPDHLLGEPMDIFAPCALGGVLTTLSVARLSARLVCGAANNQLADPEVGALLAERGVLYCPDYVVNAGGIINVVAEYLGEGEEAVLRRVGQIPQRLLQLVAMAKQSGMEMNEAAHDAAMEAVAAANPKICVA
ncbi:MAG: Glu/Leu/Phe/Val dehydrogenase dimerization domain-containing protein [Erythrobacter sp.]|uniref:Glu/Leu/Phe/Val dehydrogenase dimerization domain-containing protein n=1 Tax=Erythrobacter sp. TaxID=1042 RepID=UPI002634C09E|nr:Glu/Leu/Phe/Val dehydrogenase dimerization domain-containing protein [Erythrobacter sp.]MDJ0978125.1 Glu/Leu/Phe/Val dehydrogenase dimerization domain-containing protein [Erythrobacter sp.]